MTGTVDLSLAESVYLTLLDAQQKPIAAAADLVRALKTKTQNSGNQSHEIEMAQAEAWLAICALSKNLDSVRYVPDSDQIPRYSEMTRCAMNRHALKRSQQTNPTDPGGP